MDKIDVCINIYGKPWQTLCTLKSLIKHSGHLIDKIYVIKELEQPYNENIDWIFNYFDNIEIYTPNKYTFIKGKVNVYDYYDMLNVRYQYGIYKTDKKFLFITHNDVLYEEDIIGNMINSMGDAVGIGEIGQCWNCPLFEEKICSGDKLEENYQKKYKYEDIVSIVNKYPEKRTYYQSRKYISKENPFPMTECRLNEWACLLNVIKLKKENYPYGKIPYFGLYKGVDLGSGWFREMFLKGYKFIDYRKGFIHGYWANSHGYEAQLKQESYTQSEENAKMYFEAHFR